MGEVTETCADRPSAIVQGALAQFGRGIEFAGEANMKQRGLPVTPRAGQRNLIQLVAETREGDENRRTARRTWSKVRLQDPRPMYRDRSPAIAQTVSGQSSAVLPLAPRSTPSKPPFALGWSHYVLLTGIGDSEERAFYEIEAAENGWSIRELKRQVNAGLYERLALSRDKRGIRKLAQHGQIVRRPQDLLKEPYVPEFLGLDEKTAYSETDLESAIIDKLEHFLLEFGKGFLFEARQKRFTFDADHFFVDLVFYNRLLRCFVLIDLKIGKLTHQDLGQMQMYVNYFDRQVKRENEQPTIGIILCKKKHDALVEITLPKGANIHAREYRLYLPSKEQLRRKLVEWAEEQEEKS